MLRPNPTCASCGQPPGARGLSRGHCTNCYHRHHYAGTYIDLPRVNRSRADVVDDYLELRDQGYDRNQIAARLRMSRNALDQAIKRAARAGDARVDYQPRGAAA